MNDSPTTATFEKFVKLHLAAEDASASRLKAAIERNADKDWPAAFKEEFAAVIDRHTVSREAYRLLTNDEFDSDAEYDAWLRALWSYLYEGGADPLPKR